MDLTTISNRGQYGAFDLLGPVIEFLSPSDAPSAIYRAMIGRIHPGGAVPLHSHADVESFYVLSGSVEVWHGQGGNPHWTAAREGQLVHVPGNVKHAFRNPSNEPVVEFIGTTPKLAGFFERVGRPIRAGSRIAAPTADIERFLKTSAEYGYWNASPEENAAIGIIVPQILR